MTEPLTPSQREGVRYVESAVFAALVGEQQEARRILKEGLARGLAEEISTGLVGVAENLARRLGEATGSDPVIAWGEFMRRNL